MKRFVLLLAILGMAAACGEDKQPLAPAAITLSGDVFDVSQAGETITLTVTAPSRPYVTACPAWIRTEAVGAYADYQLEDLSMLKRLKPGNYSVDAFWLDDTDGTIGEVYLYQGGQYVGKAAQIATFTTAQAEWTEADTAAMTEQSKYISKFDKFVREGKDNIANIKVLPAEMPEGLDCLPGKASDVTLQGSAAGEVGGASLVPPASPRPADDDLDALMEKYSAADYREYAIEMA